MQRQKLFTSNNQKKYIKFVYNMMSLSSFHPRNTSWRNAFFPQILTLDFSEFCIFEIPIQKSLEKSHGKRIKGNY